MTPEQQRRAVEAERQGREAETRLEWEIRERAARGMRLAVVNGEIVEVPIVDGNRSPPPSR